MTIGFLATGDEIVCGDTLNSNTKEMANALASEGLPLGLHMSCKDSEKEIVTCLEFLKTQHDIIIITGGLGPTSDDLTRFALAEVLNTPLVENAEALAHIKARLKRANLSLNPGHHQQCLFPEIAELLPNPNGSALGCIIQNESHIFVMLPGPPYECLPMFNTNVLHRLSKTEHHQEQLLKWMLFGVAEGEISWQLEAALKGLNCRTGYRLQMPYIEFKVFCDKSLVDTITDKLMPIIEPLIISPAHQTASQQLQLAIADNQWTISINDEVTAGRLETALHHRNTHDLIQFNTKSPANIHFKLSGLEAYWKDEQSSETIITVDYAINGKIGTMSKTLVFRSPLVIYAAVEWLSFCLLQLINDKQCS